MAPPQLRGFVQRDLRNAILRAVGLGLAGGFSYKYFVAWPRKQKYVDFYKDFDAEKVAKEMEKELEMST